MKKMGFLTLVLAFAAVGSSFASDTGISNEGDISPLFIRTTDTGAEDAEAMLAWNEATVLPTDRRNFDLRSRLAFNMAQDDASGGIGTTTAAAEASGEMLNPGRALMLSAIMPGAGELYAGSPVKAAFFFALEAACWYGAVSYALRGDDKETDYQAYAEDYWGEAYYRSVEFAAAQDPNYPEGSESFAGTTSEWDNMTWDEKLDYLPDNFTHELPEEHNQQYYENVGKYLTQFGWGWTDWINGRSQSEIATVAQAGGYNWLDAGGSSALANAYIDMRYESNQLLDKSAAFFSVIMVNHVVSAMDAGFTVRSKNKKLARVEPVASQIWYYNEPVTMAGLSVQF